MANTFGQSNADDTGNRNSDKEMNSAANSSTDKTVSETENKSDDKASRDSEPHIQKSETEGKGVNPGRTPGKAEGVEDAEERGNQ